MLGGPGGSRGGPGGVPGGSRGGPGGDPPGGPGGAPGGPRGGGELRKLVTKMCQNYTEKYISQMARRPPGPPPAPPGPPRPPPGPPPPAPPGPPKYLRADSPPRCAQARTNPTLGCVKKEQKREE